MPNKHNPKLKHNWKNSILPIESSIEDVIQTLNEVALKIVLITDESGQLKGTISDGDVRRGLLNGLNLKSPILSIVQSKPFVLPSGMSRAEVLRVMAEKKVQQIPIVDKSNCVIGLYLWDAVSSTDKRSNTMVIMAGGRGTRLLPHTENCPKPMLLVRGKPMLEHIICQAKLDGISHFIISLNYLGHMIEDYFGDGQSFGVSIDYVREQSALGTAGALSLISDLPMQPILVTNGDVMTDISYGDLLDFHLYHAASATMAIREYELQNPFGVVRVDGMNIVGFEEKPIIRSHINAGIYVLDPVVMRFLNRGELCDMPTLFERIRADLMKTIAYPIHEKWIDVGRPSDLQMVNSDFLSRQ